MRFAESRFSVVSPCCLLQKKHTFPSPGACIKKRRYYSIKRSATEERIVISISIVIVIFSVCARKSFHRTKNEREREREEAFR